MTTAGSPDDRPDAAGQQPSSFLRRLTAPFRLASRALQRRVTAGIDASDTALRTSAILQRLDALEKTTLGQYHDLGAQLDALGRRLESLDALGHRIESLEAPLRPLTRCIPLGDDVLSRTPWGWLLHPVEDLALLVGMLDGGGFHESGTRRVLQCLLEPGDVCVDAGAHIGLLTVVMAHAVLPAGRVIAIEPTPRLAALLRRTAVLNNMQELVAVEACALGREDGTGLLSTDTSMMNSSLVSLTTATGAIDVTVRRLDSLIAPDTKVTLAKLDVEGAELEALAGMSRVIADSPDIARIVEFGPSHLRRAGTTVADWIGAFRMAGFTPWEIVEPDGGIRPLRDSGLDDVYSMNLLMLRHPPKRWPRLAMAA